MSDLTLRLGILIGVVALSWLVIRAGQRFVAAQRQRALSATPFYAATETANEATSATPVQILAFSTPECRQCRQFQKPALHQIENTYGAAISVVEFDASVEQQLTKTYRILTVPSTVVLDQKGSVHAINYGFANAERLRKQVDEALAEFATPQLATSK
jgi:thioredoxin-like negative regulator of GroEL